MAVGPGSLQPPASPLLRNTAPSRRPDARPLPGQLQRPLYGPAAGERETGHRPAPAPDHPKDRDREAPGDTAPSARPGLDDPEPDQSSWAAAAGGRQDPGGRRPGSLPSASLTNHTPPDPAGERIPATRRRRGQRTRRWPAARPLQRGRGRTGPDRPQGWAAGPAVRRPRPPPRDQPPGRAAGLVPRGSSPPRPPRGTSRQGWAAGPAALCRPRPPPTGSAAGPGSGPESAARSTAATTGPGSASPSRRTRQPAQRSGSPR